jgi:PPM family protein phosphatase
MVQVVGLSDVGCTRSTNEDRWEALTESQCYLLADGMGGHPAGEVAAAMTLELLKKYLSSGWDGGEDPTVRLSELLVKVNAELQQVVVDQPDLAGMGTTICVLSFVHGKAICANVGDSRIYRMREGGLEQLTRDDSLKNALLSAGRANEARRASEHFSNVVMQAMGASATIEPNLRVTEIEEDDLFLLCSDGLTDMVDDQEIEALLSTSSSLEKRAQRLIEAARRAGGSDNITVVLVEAQDG